MHVFIVLLFTFASQDVLGFNSHATQRKVLQLSRVESSSNDFTIDEIPPSSSGRKLYQTLTVPGALTFSPSAILVRPYSTRNTFDHELYKMNLAKWNQQSTTYNYELTRKCFCLQSSVGPFKVTVEDDQVTDVKFINTQITSASPDTKDFLTINQLFEIILSAAESAAIVDVRYNLRFGYPSYAMIDKRLEFADDEITYIVKLL